MVQGFSGIFGFLLLAPLDSAPGLVPFSSSLSFVIINCLQLPQLSNLKPRLSLTAQTKILELNLLGSDRPDLGHMPTIEPITGVQQLHALPMLGERTGNTGLRTIHGLCIEEERMDAVETRCCGGAGRSRGKRGMENQSYRETHLPP